MLLGDCIDRSCCRSAWSRSWCWEVLGILPFRVSVRMVLWVPTRLRAESDVFGAVLAHVVCGATLKTSPSVPGSACFWVSASVSWWWRTSTSRPRSWLSLWRSCCLLLLQCCNKLLHEILLLVFFCNGIDKRHSGLLAHRALYASFLVVGETITIQPCKHIFDVIHGFVEVADVLPNQFVLDGFWDKFR